MSDRQGTLHIGTSGFQYDHWREVFYPRMLPKRLWFSHYARHFDSVEINSTFYHLPAESVFRAWCEQAPDGFCYSLKFSRYGSHIKRLREPRQAIDHFVERADLLGRHLGPVLLQLPPRWHVNPERLGVFLETIPAGWRWAVEFRDPSWLCGEIFALLEKYGAALCLHDLIEEHPRRITTDWVYLRYHGDHYRGSYTSRFLVAEARRIRAYLGEGRDVYAYFNNDENAWAVRNAMDLARYIYKSGDV